jgi:hypothetical protein
MVLKTRKERRTKVDGAVGKVLSGKTVNPSGIQINPADPQVAVVGAVMAVVLVAATVAVLVAAIVVVLVAAIVAVLVAAIVVVLVAAIVAVLVAIPGAWGEEKRVTPRLMQKRTRMLLLLLLLLVLRMGREQLKLKSPPLLQLVAMRLRPRAKNLNLFSKLWFQNFIYLHMKRFLDGKKMHTADATILNC